MTTPDELEAEVIEWYRTCLGLELIVKPEGARPAGAWFQAGGQEIHISVDEHNPPKASHFGLVVDDFEAVVRRLREAGVHIEQARPIADRRRLFTRDPAGNRIEILSYGRSRMQD